MLCILFKIRAASTFRTGDWRRLRAVSSRPSTTQFEQFSGRTVQFYRPRFGVRKSRQQASCGDGVAWGYKTLRGEFQNESGVCESTHGCLVPHCLPTLASSITRRILISRKRVTAVLRTQTAVCPRLRDCAGRARAEVSDSDRASPERLWAIPFTRSEPDGSFNSEVRIEMAARGCGPPHFPPCRCGEESLRSERGSGYPSSPRRWRLLGRGLRSAHH
jgi:hypothetical protein